jgi:hypothetical protein
MRSIIVEGMDGTGKDTLIGTLREAFPDHTLHVRASTSLGGPVNNLSSWVVQDAQTMDLTGPWIYNRHPLISEPIYGHIRPTKAIVEPFNNSAWLSAYRRIIARDCVVVICQPPWTTVQQTLIDQGPDAHMPGVFENARELYEMYAALVWPGRAIRYDYTKDKTESLIDSLTRMLVF